MIHYSISQYRHTMAKWRIDMCAYCLNVAAITCMVDLETEHIHTRNH